MKDFDDLWRISKSKVDINSSVISKLSQKMNNIMLDIDWINEDFEKAWKKHAKRYTDVPLTITEVFKDINIFLKGL